MYKVILYSEWKQRLSSLSKCERWDFIFILFDFWEYLENNPTKPNGFTHSLFENRILQLSFDTVKETIIKDFESYRKRCEANINNWKKWGRKPIIIDEKEKPKTTHKNPMGLFWKNPILLYTNNIYYNIIKEYININNSNIKYLINNKWEEKFFNEQYQEIDKLIKDWYDLETIKTILLFIKQDEFWSKNILVVWKLRKKDKEWIPYIVRMISAIQNFKPQKEMKKF